MRIKLLLFFILFLGIILRFWNLSNNPPGLTWDEAAIGYNAYSLLKTAKDEYGNILPVNLKSFGDYKPALYAYLTIPFIAFFGLNETSVRLPAVISGVLSIIVIFLLVNELFKNHKLALITAFFFAISPLSIQFSRPSFEASLALLLNLLGIYFFIRGQKDKKYLIFSSVIFGLSLFTYQASRIFVPLIIIILVFIFKNNFKSFKSYSLVGKVISLGNYSPVGKVISYRNYRYPLLIIISVIILFFLTTVLTEQTKRLATLNFFSYRRSEEEILKIFSEDGMEKNDIKFQILHGEWLAYVRGLVERYLIYFSPKMLIIDGDYSQRHKVPDLGVMYYFSTALLPLGIFYFLNFYKKDSKLLFIWLLISPIPAVLSRDLISMVRALNMTAPLEILQAGGLIFIVGILEKYKKNIGKIGYILTGIIISFNVLIYLDRYFIHAPYEFSKYWLYGYKEAVRSLEEVKNSKNYDKIIMSDTYGQPYIYYLFYTKYPPLDFQKQAYLDQPNVDVGTVRKIDNIEFRHIYWPGDRSMKNSLFIGTKEELPDQDILPFNDFKIIKDINFLNGEPAFRIVETK